MLTFLSEIRRWPREALLKPAVVLGVLGLAYYLAPRASVSLALMLAGVAGALVLMRWPQPGLLILLVAAVSVPFAVGTGTQTALPAPTLLIPVLLVLWLADALRRRRVRVVSSPTNTPLLVFVVVTLVCFLAGSLPWSYFTQTASLQAQAGGAAVFLLSAGLFLWVGNQITDLRWLKAVTWLFVLLGSVVVAARVVPYLAPVATRFVLDQVVQGSLFWVWLTAMTAGQAVFNASLRRSVRLGLIGLALTCLGVQMFQNQGWFSGWLMQAVVLMTLLWLYSWRLGAAIVIVGAVGVALLDPGLPARLVAGDQYSIETRLVAWRIIFDDILPLNPILGVGFANYYHASAMYPILGWFVRFNSHNQYVDILAQTGLVGLAAFAWLAAAIGSLSWSLKRRLSTARTGGRAATPGGGPLVRDRSAPPSGGVAPMAAKLGLSLADAGFARGYVCGCLGGLAGTLTAGMLGDWLLPFVYNVGLQGFRTSMLAWLFLGGLVAILRLVSPAASASAGNQDG